MHFHKLFPALLSLVLLHSCKEKNNNVGGDGVEQQVSVDSNTASGPAAAPQVPSFTVLDAAGGMVNLQSFRGKKLVVNIWASWCPPCRREMPSIEKLYKSVDTARVAFVLLSLDDQFETAKKYIAKQKLDLPVYYPAQNLPQLFNVPGIPATFIFNERGELIKHVEGGDDYNTTAYRSLLK